MKTLRLACVVTKINSRIEFNNLLPLKDKKNVRLLKGEKIEETITILYKDWLALNKK